MAVQRISRSNFRIGGAYTNNVISVVNHFYNGRAHRTSSRTTKFPPPEGVSNLIVEAERLQRTARELSNELWLTTSSEIEHNDFVATLVEIANDTIPYLFQIYLHDRQCDIRRQHRLSVEVACMQRTLDEFVKKRATHHAHANESVRRVIGVDAIVDLLWSHVRWLFYPQHPTAAIVRSLTISHDRICALLFKDSMASSIGKRIHCHQIDIDDFFGAHWSLPQDLCLDREVFFSILRFKFHDGPAKFVVTAKQFGVFRQDGLRAIQVADWKNVIKEGDGLQLSVFVSRPSEDMAKISDVPECPQCGQNDRTIPGDSSDGWVTCLRCNNSFNVAPADLGNDGDPRDRNLSSLSPTDVNDLSAFRYFSITKVPAPSPSASDLEYRGGFSPARGADGYKVPEKAGYGFGRQGEKRAQLRGFFL